MSFISFWKIDATSTAAISPEPQSSSRLRRTTNLPNMVIREFSRGRDPRTRTGSSESSAGRKVTESTNAVPTPNATKLPRWRKGGDSEKCRLRKPSVVVRLERKTG